MTSEFIPLALLDQVENAGPVKGRITKVAEKVLERVRKQFNEPAVG